MDGPINGSPNMSIDVHSPIDDSTSSAKNCYAPETQESQEHQETKGKIGVLLELKPGVTRSGWEWLESMEHQEQNIRARFH